MSSTTQPSIVVDASLFLAVVLPSPYRRQAQGLWQKWLVERCTLYVPHLWIAEVTSGLRQGIWNQVMTEAEAYQALKQIRDIPLSFIADIMLAPDALRWA